jgi:hypothetical protein
MSTPTCHLPLVLDSSLLPSLMATSTFWKKFFNADSRARISARIVSP